MKNFLKRLRTSLRKILLDCVWMAYGLYIVVMAGANTSNTTVRDIFYALGLGVLATGFIRLLGHLWGDETDEALNEILAEQKSMRDEMRTEFKQLRSLIEQRNDQK